MLITLEQAKAHLRYDTDDEDAYIQGLIDTAEAVIERHVDDYDKENRVFQQAALLLIGYWDNRRNAEEEDSNSWYLPAPVLALLTPYRTPTAV